MPRKCTVCLHRERAAIEQAIVAGETFRGVARRFAASADAVERHARAHLPASLVAGAQAADVAHGDGLLHRLEALAADARRIADRAEEAGDYRTALTGVRELVRIVQVTAAIALELNERTIEQRVAEELEQGFDAALGALERVLPADMYVIALDVLAGEEGRPHA